MTKRDRRGGALRAIVRSARLDLLIERAWLVIFTLSTRTEYSGMKNEKVELVGKKKESYRYVGYGLYVYVISRGAIKS